MTPKLGDRVRIDIPDETDPDFALHGEHEPVIEIERSQSCKHDVCYEFTLENPDYEFMTEIRTWNLDHQSNHNRLSKQLRNMMN